MAAERRELEGLLVHVDELAKPRWPVDFARLGQLNGAQIAVLANGPGPKLGWRRGGRGENETDNGQDWSASGSVEACILRCMLVTFLPLRKLWAGCRPGFLPAPNRLRPGNCFPSTASYPPPWKKPSLAGPARMPWKWKPRQWQRARKQYHIPFYAVRVVTDTSEESFPLDFNSMRSSDGRFSRARILAAALRRPATIFPELLKLNKTTKRASQALGDFLADARF